MKDMIILSVIIATLVSGIMFINYKIDKNCIESGGQVITNYKSPINQCLRKALN